MLPHSGFLRAIRLNRDEVADWKEYPFAIPAVHTLERLEFHPAVTFFVGENGSGKSTLLEAIAVRSGFNAEGGSKSFNFATRASHSPLHRHLTLERGARRPDDGYFLRAESLYNVATEIERLDAEEGTAPFIGPAYGGKGLHEQSHGQAFFSLITNRLDREGFYLFDEPEAALSPTRQMSALTLMDNMIQRGSQLIIATHSPILLAYPHATIYEFGAHGIRKVGYTETEQFQVTRDFLNRHEKMVGYLLGKLPID